MLVVGYDGAELLEITAVTTTFLMASELGVALPPYRVEVATPGGRPIPYVSGLMLQGPRLLERVDGALDTLIVSGGPGSQAAAGDPRMIDAVRRLARRSRRVASVCTGADILAAARLLDGRRATTHWRHAEALAKRHPAVMVDSAPIYVRDGNVFTAAGLTSALDLSLAFVELDHGANAARVVARHLVTYLQRPGSQAQMSMYLAGDPPQSGLVKRVVDHITTHLDKDLSADVLAACAGVSERHLNRLFQRDLDQTPGRYVRQARVEAAAQLLASSMLTVPHVATRCGFRSAESLRQAFVAHYGIPPSQYRARHARSSA
ncbi:MAG: helix-turn-helix domain-containing protein [Actinomycetota bacterium]|nr:helix-turn-helix domain-containing protein [Actinomycetota bacterium]